MQKPVTCPGCFSPMHTTNMTAEEESLNVPGSATAAYVCSRRPVCGTRILHVMARDGSQGTMHAPLPVDKAAE